MSVWHTPQAASRTSTSPALGSASSTSCTTSGRPNSSRTAARIFTARTLIERPMFIRVAEREPPPRLSLGTELGGSMERQPLAFGVYRRPASGGPLRTVWSMGAWGPGSFENDAALDWAWELDEDLDASALRRALAAVYDGKTDEEAVAAAEVVAALSAGPPPPRHPTRSRSGSNGPTASSTTTCASRRWQPCSTSATAPRSAGYGSSPAGATSGSRRSTSSPRASRRSPRHRAREKKWPRPGQACGSRPSRPACRAG